MSGDVLAGLVETIRARRSASGDRSYTRQLLDQGVEKCAKKFGEEAVETVIAAMAQSDERLCSESADVIYHLLVLLESRNIEFAEVLAVLASRKVQSGLEEKAGRRT
ncbi:MAG TPA: phosphoribosyl-ATP diphosphatase [Hyphomicrobiaceae bacterium]|nr:phosphoribosyl-ATP diphosphatase [Hyphomicrobiaceae bacterium]